MQGPPLSRRELAAALDRRVEQLEGSGVPRPLAIQVTARERELDGSRVAWLLDRDAEAAQNREAI